MYTETNSILLNTRFNDENIYNHNVITKEYNNKYQLVYSSNEIVLVCILKLIILYIVFIIFLMNYIIFVLYLFFLYNFTIYITLLFLSYYYLYNLTICISITIYITLLFI